MFALLALTLAATPLPPQVKADGLSAADWAKLQAGKVVDRTETHKTKSGKDAGQGRAWVIINAPPAVCYATLYKYQDTPQYMPRVKKVIIRSKTPTSMVVVQDIGVVFSTYEYTMDFAFDPAKKSMHWKLDKSVKNDIKATTGHWRFIPLPKGKTLLDYAVSADTGHAVPKFISNYLTRRDLPDVLTSFKRRVESGGKWTK